MKLRFHLIALVLVVVVPVMLFSIVVVTLVARHEREATDRSLRTRTHALAAAADALLDKSISSLQALGTSEHLDNGDLAGFYRAAARVVPHHEGWLSIALFEPAGRQVLNTLRPLGDALPVPRESAYVPRLAGGHRPTVSNYLIDAVTGRGHVAVAIPVVRDTALKYVLVAAVDVGALQPIFAGQQMPPEGIGAIVDGAGTVLARTRQRDAFVGRSAPANYLELTRDGTEGSSRGPSNDGVQTHTTFSRSGVAPWTVTLAVPTTIMDASLLRFVGTIAGGAAVFLLAGVVLATLLGRRIASAIASVSASAEALGRGETLPAPTPSDVDEVNQLQRALHAATEQRQAIEQERAGLLAREQAARAEAEAAQVRSAFLADASTVLSSSLDYETMLQSVANLAVPTLADLCVIDLTTPEGDIRRVAAAHADPEKDPLVRALQDTFPPHRSGRHPVATVLRTGRPELASDITESLLAAIPSEADHRRLTEALGYSSHLVVPLVARGRTFGAISLVATGSGRRYTERDVPLAEDLARRAAVAVDNARLFRQSEARLRAAEGLAEAGRLLGHALDPDVVGERIAESVRALLGLQTSVFYVVDPESLDMTVVAASGKSSPLDRHTMIPAGTATVGLAVRERRTIATSNFLADDRFTMPPELRERLAGAAYRSVLAVPLISHTRVVGVLALGDRQGRVFTAEEIVLAQGFADQAALALENARLYAEARHANRAKDEFLATLSHELRTPLTAMLGWVRMLQSGKLDPPTAARALEVIDRNTKLQAQLIDDLLDVSRIITGKLHLDLRPVDLVAVIDSAIDAVEQGAEAKGIRLQRRLDPAVGPVWGDAHRLQQVVWNLLSNAIKFTPPLGTVEVRLERVDPHARITVADSGKGIHPDFLPLLFERFSQADSTSTRAYGGLGVGLAIVRHLVGLHRGSVQAHSDGEGRGATFEVRLPLAAVRLSSDAPTDGSGAAGMAVHRFPVLTGVRVLVVDDEADARDLVTAVLQQSGADVVTAASVLEALDALGRVRPNVLVSDISMPDEDGYALIRRVRALGLDRGGRTPAVALTAYARAEDRARALAVGFQMHLPKPVEPAELVEIVAELAGRGVRRDRPTPPGLEESGS